MTSVDSDNLSTLKKIIAVITGALLTGFMWHVRGQHGFGSKWGVFSVGLVLMLFVFTLYPKRRKMNYEMIPLCAAFMCITAGGWGTLNSQMSGYLGSNACFSGEEVYRYVEIDPLSGLAIMLLLGFGWMPLFAVVFGSLFSEKEYKIKDYIIFAAVYYVTMLVCSVTVAHPILSLINPQAVENCALGIADAGHDLTPWAAFVKNLGSASWAKPIPFCRNYFTSIKVISSALGAFACTLSVRFALKDKTTAVISLLVNAVSAVAITAADFVMITDSDRGFLAGVDTPTFIEANAWELWEYFTGFLLGLGIMLIVVCLPRKMTSAQPDYEYIPLIKNNRLSMFYHTVFTLLFSFGVTLSRAFALRGVEMFADSDTLEIIATAVLSEIAFVPCFITAKKNILTKNLQIPVDKPVWEFAKTGLYIYVSAASVAYFVLGKDSRMSLLNIDYSLGFGTLWQEGKLTDPILMLATLVLILVLFTVCTTKKKNKVS